MMTHKIFHVYLNFSNFHKSIKSIQSTNLESCFRGNELTQQTNQTKLFEFQRSFVCSLKITKKEESGRLMSR